VHYSRTAIFIYGLHIGTTVEQQRYYSSIILSTKGLHQARSAFFIYRLDIGAAIK
jgi:hypothetical protein